MTLFDRIHDKLHGTDNKRGWYDTDCPFCGKEVKNGHGHFSYRVDEYGRGGFHCFHCGASGNLGDLADKVLLPSERDGEACAPVKKPVEAPPPRPIARWRQNPDGLLGQYRTHPDLYTQWAAHKPLMPETIDRFGFGLGRLPYQRNGEWRMSPHNRLIVPLYRDGQLVGLKGRAYEPGDTGSKWMSATGTEVTPWGIDRVEVGGLVWICENYVDAAWLMQQRKGEFAVALGSVNAWKDENTWALARQKPSLVVVALDNDLPGQAQGKLRERLEAEWRADPKHKGQPPSISHGVRMVRDLRERGLKTYLFEWPEEAPPKAGIDWILSEGRM